MFCKIIWFVNNYQINSIKCIIILFVYNKIKVKHYFINYIIKTTNIILQYIIKTLFYFSVNNIIIIVSNKYYKYIKLVYKTYIILYFTILKVYIYF